ncbi:4Fe-4S binding protein [bacterium]|nr:4Fe-4S binding protein [bacterium]
MKELSLIYFSPTKTTQKIVYEIAKGISTSIINEINLTYDLSSHSVTGTVIVGSPVYAGRLPKVFKDRLSKIDLRNLNIILVVVYGNRAFDDSLLELKDIIEGKGGNVIGAGAFIGEHSYSNEQKPIAKGRPDESDLKIAYDFGRKLAEIKENQIKKIILPGDNPYCETKPKSDVTIKTDENRCIGCNQCINSCPVEAISKDNPLITNGGLCLRCCACIKFCPMNARELKDSLSLKLIEMVFEKSKIRKEPEIFI